MALETEDLNFRGVICLLQAGLDCFTTAQFGTVV